MKRGDDNGLLDVRTKVTGTLRDVGEEMSTI